MHAAASIVCLASTGLLAPAAYALDPAKRISQYLHTSWRIADGSAPAGVLASATQTPDGFIWFSPYAPTLYRFDGVRFVQRQYSYKGGSGNKIFKVFADGTGGLWTIGSREIAYIKDGAVAADFPLDGFSSFQNVSEASDGSLWVVRAAANIADEALCRVTPGAFRCFGKADGVPISPIDTVLADGKGGLWLGGQTSVVHWRDGVSQSYPIEALKSNVGQHGVVSLVLDRDGVLWVGMLAEGPGLGLAQLKDGVVKPFVTPGFDGSTIEVYSMILDREGSLWVATRGNGLYRIHGDAVDHYGRSDGLLSDSVQLVFEDKEGNLWVTTADGVESFRDPRVTTFSPLEGLSKDGAAGVLAASDGSVWVANDGSLDRITGNGISSIRAGAGLPGHQVAALYEDRAGNLWVGVDDSLYVLKSGRFLPIATQDRKPLGLVIALAEDADGSMWAECAGASRKLVRIRDFQVFEEFPVPQVPAARALAPDPRGGVWIATTTGNLLHFANGASREFALNLKGSPVIRRLVARADGSVMAASEDGLVGLRDGKVQRMTAQNGLPCTSVFSVAEGSDKRWWLYTECGVVELADAEFERWWADPAATVQTRLYDRFDGARPNPPYFNPASRSPDGRVWFANGQVVQMIDPAAQQRRTPMPQAFIEAVTVDRSEFPAAAGLVLAPRPRTVQIDYTAPVFTSPQKLRFRYRLDGYDDDWRDAGARRQAFYTDLPPGEYAFRVAAANGDGVWSETPATLIFSVAPAYYQTNWFRALCAVLLLVLLWAGYQLRVRRLRRQFEVTLDARVAERTRIARDLHDTLLQSFHGLLLRFQTALSLLPGRPGEARNVLASAIDQAAEAITEGRDAVQGLRTSATEMNDLADSIRALGEELASENGNQASLRVEVQGAPRDLHPIVRDEVFRIGSEALRNAYRHAGARQIEVELRYDQSQVRLRVRDDGKGIDPEVLRKEGRERHFGLHGMRERAELVGGKLTVWTGAETGTEVELSVPRNRAYSSSSSPRSWLAGKRRSQQQEADAP